MNVIKKVWHFVRPYIFKYYVAFFCGGMFWMFLDVYVTKGIDASFVSAFADIALVVFAVLAFYQAKRIWVDRTKQDGYKIALDLLHDKLNETKLKMNGVAVDFILTEGILSTLYSLIKNWEDTYENRERLSHSIELLMVHKNSIGNQLDKNIKPLSNEIKNNIFRLRHMLIRFSNKGQGKRLDEYFKDYVRLYNISQQYYSQLFYFDLYIQTTISLYDTIPDMAIKINEMIDTNKEAEELIQKIEKSHTLIVEDESSTLLDYFDF